MKNPYRIEGPVTKIRVRDPEWADDKVVTIDTDDLPRVRAISGSWSLVKINGVPQILGRVKGKPVLLHRYLVGVNHGKIFHLDRDKLNNRRSNLWTTQERAA